MSDFDLSEARDFIAAAEKFDAQFGGLIRGAKMLKGMVSLEQAAREAEQRLEVLRGKVAEAETDIAHKHISADMKIAENHAAADRGIAEKHRKADDLIADAEQKAGRIVSAARDEAAGFAERVEAHKITIGSLGEEITRLKAEIAGHDQARDKAKSDAAEAKRQHDGEVARLRSFRASLPPVE